MSQKQSILCKSMIAGCLIGGAASLLHGDTRRRVRRRVSKAAACTSDFVKTWREDPQQMQRQLQETAQNIQALARDVRRESQDVVDTIQDVRTHSRETYQSIKKTGGELRDLGGKLRDSAGELQEGQSDTDRT